MGYTLNWLNKILGQIQADNDVLRETRRRRDVVLAAGRTFEGILRSFPSGSVAHGTVIKPVGDADGGSVLDRRHYPELGPDGGEIGPREIVARARDHVLPIVRRVYPRAIARITKRAIKVSFDEAFPSGEDPSVDMVIALTRQEANGLWIPNTENDSWDASHPEMHTELLTGGAEEIRVLRARVIRLAKGSNKQYSDPAISSFNIEALSLDAIVEVSPLDLALNEFFAFSARDLAQRLTPDPAGVSDPIKCPNRNVAVRRLQTAADALKEALSHDEDEELVKEALSRVFWEFVDVPPSTDSKAAMASALRKGAIGMLAGKASTSVDAKQIKRVRSSGDPR